MEIPSASTINPDEIARFSKLADTWWDARGPFAPLHRINPLRIEWITQRTGTLQGKTLLDVGCGGGLMAEPMARLGAQVTAIDASEKNIRIAQLHAEKSALSIDYRHTSIEQLSAQPAAAFDIILALEIIEHVENPDLFIRHCAQCLKPGGLLFVSTLNRTAKSFALAIVGAEYILRWLPVGTHDWRKFLRPGEVAQCLRESGLELQEQSGMVFHPWRQTWVWNPTDLSVNYMVMAQKPSSRE